MKFFSFLMPWTWFGGKDKKAKWGDATITEFVGSTTCDTVAYYSHQSVELDKCVPYSDGSPDYVIWGKTENGLERYYFGADATCDEANKNEGSTQTWEIPDKDAETMCTVDGSNSYMVTMTRESFSVTTYTDDSCETEIEEIEDRDDLGECLELDGGFVYKYEWRGDAVVKYDYSAAPGCPD